MSENMTQVMDLAATIILFEVGCMIRKLVMNTYDTWLSFNGLAIGVLVIGELVWWEAKTNFSKKRKDGD